MIEKISNLPSWRIGDFVFTFEQLEKLYYAIGAELLDVAVENGDTSVDDGSQRCFCDAWHDADYAWLRSFFS